MLQNRHGTNEEITICLNIFSEETIISNEMLTIAELGLVGKVPVNASISPDGTVLFDDSQLPLYQIYYDINSSSQLDPLLLF